MYLGAGMRSASNVLAAILLAVVAIASLTVAFTVITSYIRSKQPRGEVIDYHVTVERYVSSNLVTLKASLLVSCYGPACDQYEIVQLGFRGYVREQGEFVNLYYNSGPFKLKRGLTRIDTVGYHPPSKNVNEVVLSFVLMGPGVSRVVVESVTIG